MYPHFIEVHDGSQILIINVDKIGIVKDQKIMVEHPTRWQPVDESYEELKELISDSGCSITKSDPRIDTTHPLKMSDLKEMIGEPVWNSNRRHWALVSEYIESDDDYVFISFRPYKDVGYEYDEDDLIKYPVYRMKVPA